MVTLLSALDSFGRAGAGSQRRVRLPARSSTLTRRLHTPEGECGPELAIDAKGRGSSFTGLIGIDGSARQQGSSRSQRTALAQTGNLKCERQRSHRDRRVHRGRHRPARGLRELERPGRRVTAPTRRTARRDELTRAGKDGALVEAAHAAPYAGRRHCCTTWPDAGSIPASSTLGHAHGCARRDA